MTIQELQFQLMRQASFNSFDGEKVVKSLLKHKDLWRGVIMDRAGYAGIDYSPYSACIDLIKLRDIEDNLWNVDTVYILPKEGKEKELEKLAKTWGADEVDYEDGDLGTSGAGVNNKVLRVWWD